MKSTIVDVAKEAKVSITTVSRVLNNNYPVKLETRIKVEEAIKKLNFKPNNMARSLITRKTSNIGVVVPGLTNLFFPTVVESIEKYLKRNGYIISLCNTSADPLKEAEIIDELVSRQADGIIVIDPTMDNFNNHYFEKISKSIPLLIVNGGTDGYRCNSISYNEETGTLEAFEHLLKLGHSKIALVRGYKSHSYDIKEEMYKNMIKEKKLSYSKVINIGNGNSLNAVLDTQKAVEKLLTGKNRPTAFFACNDLMAVGILNACSNVGISVPGDISVIGFDNTLLAEISNPKLTSVDLNMKQIGHKAALELLDIITYGFNVNRKVVLDTRLVVRQSCGEAR